MYYNLIIFRIIHRYFVIYNMQKLRIKKFERIRRIVLRGSIANQLNRNDDFTYPIFLYFHNVIINILMIERSSVFDRTVDVSASDR